jgi:hypothetical protein
MHEDLQEDKEGGMGVDERRKGSRVCWQQLSRKSCRWVRLGSQNDTERGMCSRMTASVVRLVVRQTYYFGGCLYKPLPSPSPPLPSSLCVCVCVCCVCDSL